jgi:hypothetical protein
MLGGEPAKQRKVAVAPGQRLNACHVQVELVKTSVVLACTSLVDSVMFRLRLPEIQAIEP